MNSRSSFGCRRFCIESEKRNNIIIDVRKLHRMFLGKELWKINSKKWKPLFTFFCGGERLGPVNDLLVEVEVPEHFEKLAGDVVGFLTEIGQWHRHARQPTPSSPPPGKI